MGLVRDRSKTSTEEVCILCHVLATIGTHASELHVMTAWLFYLDEVNPGDNVSEIIWRHERSTYSGPGIV